MASDGRVVFEITGDNGKVLETVKQTTSAIQTESKKWDAAVEDSTENMTAAFNKALDVNRVKNYAIELGKALLKFGKEAISAASDLAEVQNVVDVTFGDSAGVIQKWADNASRQFGLTETQAKRFTSTLGAMFKSSGIKGDEIVQMSTDLAGLAADMASFYNLDFDTAFQKIRSGISGETEPLKQLGINMSVANLEAFALSKGITQAFNSMSQGEQTLLRYQYLMQATSDAQGDFARTSDGFANASRRVESALEQLKTNIGTTLLGYVEPFIGKMAEALEAITAKPEETLFDRINAIEYDKQKQLDDIAEVAREANNLIDLLGYVSGTNAGEALQSMASGANALDSGSPDTWTALFGSLQSIDGLQNIFKSDTAGKNIESLANALSGSSVDTSKAEAWKTFLGALSANAEAVSKLTGESVEQTSAWLSGLADSVDDINPDDVDAWDQLLTTLITKLSATPDGQAFAESIAAVAGGANLLDSSSPTTWTSLFNALQKVDGLQNLFGSNSSAAGNIKSLAEALSSSEVDSSKAEAWKTFLGALSENAGAVSSLTGKSVEETAAWLETLSGAVNSIDAGDVDAWNKLLTTLLQGFTGETPEGQQFIQGLAEQFLAMGTDSNAAVKGLQALGFSSDQITDKQKSWLDVCKQLVQTIPGLSEVVNTETGEVQGGIGALKQYVDEWKSAQEKLVMWRAYYAKQAALAETKGSIAQLELAMGGAGIAVQNYLKEHEQIAALYSRGGILAVKDKGGKEAKELIKLLQDEKAATDAYNTALEQSGDTEEQLANQAQYLTQKYGDVTEAEIEAADAANQLTSATEEQAQAVANATAELTKAQEELEKYYAKSLENTLSTIEKEAAGFEKVLTPADQAREKVKDLKKELESAEDKSKIEIRIEGYADEIPTASKMIEGLRSQIEYFNEYAHGIQELKRRGLSDTVLAALSDGSAESLDYIRALSLGTDKDIEEINKLYGDMELRKESLGQMLTDNRMKVDTEYQAIEDKITEAQNVIATAGDAAAQAAGEATGGIATAISEKVPEVQAAVDALNSALSNLGIFGGGILSGLFSGFHLDGSFATGLDYVPHNGFLAELHEGEGILTAEENRIWQRFKNGGASIGNVMDYDALGGVMRDNVRTGGNVYLDGRVVGAVVSDIQGKSYRTMKKSGWQA